MKYGGCKGNSDLISANRTIFIKVIKCLSRRNPHNPISSHKLSNLIGKSVS